MQTALSCCRREGFTSVRNWITGGNRLVSGAPPRAMRTESRNAPSVRAAGIAGPPRPGPIRSAGASTKLLNATPSPPLSRRAFGAYFAPSPPIEACPWSTRVAPCPPLEMCSRRVDSRVGWPVYLSAAFIKSSRAADSLLARDFTGPDTNTWYLNRSSTGNGRTTTERHAASVSSISRAFLNAL